jgi:hypothetical protein
MRMIIVLAAALLVTAASAQEGQAARDWFAAHPEAHGGFVYYAHRHPSNPPLGGLNAGGPWQTCDVRCTDPKSFALGILMSDEWFTKNVRLQFPDAPKNAHAILGFEHVRPCTEEEWRWVRERPSPIPEMLNDCELIARDGGLANVTVFIGGSLCVVGEPCVVVGTSGSLSVAMNSNHADSQRWNFLARPVIAERPGPRTKFLTD